MKLKGLKVGDKAPYFEGYTQDGDLLKLTDYQGSKIILFFYPKDMTPGCTLEARNLQDNYKQISNEGFVVIGVSADSVARHKKFCEKENLTYNLIADENKVILKDYGVWGLKKFMGREYDGIHRTTFVIDEHGLIQKIIEKVKTKDHAAQILGEI